MQKMTVSGNSFFSKRFIKRIIGPANSYRPAKNDEIFLTYSKPGSIPSSNKVYNNRDFTGWYFNSDK